LPRQLHLPEFRQDQPTGGDVETGRGKKSRKTGWHLTLRLKDVIFAGIGVVGLMMMSFALGTLAGRGDIYRLAYSWGLLNPDRLKVAQWTPPSGPAAVAPPAAPGTATAPTAAAAVGSAPVTAAAKPPPAPVTGSIAPLPPPAAAKKKGKTGTLHRDHKSREEELQRVRQEVVPKLKFQNSFDTGPKPRLPKGKDHDKAQAKAGGDKAKPAQVRVGQYRDSKEAQAKVAELHKKGVKATLKKTKDSKGTLYIVYKTTSPTHSNDAGLARKPDPSNSPPRKFKVE
jgi:hypothetical protein